MEQWLTSACEDTLCANTVEQRPGGVHTSVIDFRQRQITQPFYARKYMDQNFNAKHPPSLFASACAFD